MTACVLGLDLSLTSTGWAVVTTSGPERLVASGLIKTGGASSGLAPRLRTICEAIQHVRAMYSIYDVMAERPFVGGAAGATGSLWAVYGAVVAYGVGQDVGLVSPNTVKKFATGNGHAKKDAMMAAAEERFGIDLTNDEADAAFVAAYCATELRRATV